MDEGPADLDRQLTDLRDLRAAARRRHTFSRNTPEWLEAVKVEEALIERIRLWVRPIGVRGPR